MDLPWSLFGSSLSSFLGVVLLSELDRLERCHETKLCSLDDCFPFAFNPQYSFTAVDRVVQRSLPKTFVNMYRHTAYLELTNAYGLFRRYESCVT